MWTDHTDPPRPTQWCIIGFVIERFGVMFHCKASYTVTCGVDQWSKNESGVGSNFLIPPMMMALSLDVVCVWFHRYTKKTCKARNRIEQITVKKSVHLVTDETRQRSWKVRATPWEDQPCVVSTGIWCGSCRTYYFRKALEGENVWVHWVHWIAIGPGEEDSRLSPNSIASINRLSTSS